MAVADHNGLGMITAAGDYAAGTWGPENTQTLLAPGHRWPLPTELVATKKSEVHAQKTLFP
jgi:hypothetical protein